MPKELCSSCVEREKSKERCREYLKRHPDGKGGMICDPAPKAECKWHELYGEKEDYQKIRCRDYRPVSRL